MLHTKSPSAQQSVYDLYAFFLTLFLLLICAFFLQKIVPPNNLETENVKEAFIPAARWYLLPETHERTLFVALIVLLLPLNYMAIRMINLLKTTQDKLFNNLCLQKTIVLAAPIFFLLPICSADFLRIVTGGIQTYWLSACATTVLVMIFFLPALTLHSVSPQTKKNILTRWGKPSLIAILLSAILISVLSFRVRSTFEINEGEQWILHFEAVFYTVSQVVAGKTLLVNLPAQYGLYAEILKPFFSIIRLSVLSFTSIMTFLQLAGMLALLWLCMQLIKNNILKFLCVTSICSIIGETWRLRMCIAVGYPFDALYQVWPLRFIFPALSLCAFYNLQKHSRRYKAITLMACFSGLAIVWNLDSGIPVFGAFLAYSLLQFIFPIHESRWFVIKKTLLAIIIVSIWIIGFGIYLQFKAGQAIYWQDWTKYQQIFYHSGFGMLPIPVNTLHPWMSVVSVYALAITGAISKRMQKKSALIWDMLFFMSILGLGLFSYYQGRSHFVNLIQVSWPAIIMAFILTDRTMRAIKAKLLPFVFVDTLLPITLLGLILSAIFINSVPILLSTAQQNVQLILQAPKTRVTQNISFIRYHTQNEKQAAIISPHQAVYFAETGLASAINGPGIVETMLVADFEHFFYVLRTKPVKHLFVEQDKLPQVLAKLNGHYKIKDRSSYGLVYLSTI